MKTQEEKYGWPPCNGKKLTGRTERYNDPWKESFADKVANVALVIGAIFVVSLFLRALMW
jgi:hypothetical protein